MLMDAFELLKKDHKKVSQLFQEVEAASGQTKKQKFSRLKTELDVHATTEERIFYPALENKEAAREITLEAYEEHNLVKDLLGELDNGDPAQDEWDAKLTVLKENVEHHVEEEEGELFSKARQVLSKQEIEELGVEMEAEKASQLAGAPEGSRRPGAQAATKSSRGAGKKSNGSESAGVLARLAKLVGLGGSSTTKQGGAKGRKPSKAGKSAASKKAGKKTGTAASAGKKRSSKAGKKAAKKSGTKSTKASRSRGAAKKSLTRRTSGKKTQALTTSKRGRAR
jgi:hemerythrin-like domain-containing protein